MFPVKSTIEILFSIFGIMAALRFRCHLHDFVVEAEIETASIPDKGELRGLWKARPRLSGGEPAPSRNKSYEPSGRIGVAETTRFQRFEFKGL